MTAQPFTEQIPGALMAITLCTPRVLVFLYFSTLFPSTIFPRLLQVPIAIGLASPAAFGVFHQAHASPEAVDVATIVLKECVLGLAMALPTAGPMWAVQSVGTLIDNQRGANAAQQVTPFSQADASPIGSALTQALIVVLATSGILVLLYRLLLQSYEAWPVLQLAPELGAFGFERAVANFDDWVTQALLFTLPVLCVILLVDFAFGLVSVFAPQLQAYFASMPIKSLAAIAVLGLYVHVLLGHADGHFREVLHRQVMSLESLRR
jgi:type III secretion protein T